MTLKSKIYQKNTQKSGKKKNFGVKLVIKILLTCIHKYFHVNKCILNMK